jgi:hypothetical protein
MVTKNGNQSVAAKVTHVSKEVDSWRPTQYEGFRVNEHPTKVSVDTNKQTTFSMDTARLYKRPCREERFIALAEAGSNTSTVALRVL